MLAVRGEQEDAAQFLDYAIELSAADSELVKGVSLVYLDMGMPQKALEVLTTIKSGKAGLGLKIVKAVAKTKLLFQRMRNFRK